MRRTARLGFHFPLSNPKPPAPPESDKPYGDATSSKEMQAGYGRQFDGGMQRGVKSRTKSHTGEVEMDTYVTCDGGRIDWVKVEWPPKILRVSEASLEKVRVKHGVPWPSLYGAIDAFSGSVTLRYIIDSSHPSLASLETDDACPTCVDPGRNSSVIRPLRLDFSVEKFIRNSIYYPTSPWRHWLYCRLIDIGVYRYAASALLDVSRPYFLSPEQVHDLLQEDIANGVSSVLDIGAGAGEVSQVFMDTLKPPAGGYIATELSGTLVKKLKKRGISAHLADSISPEFLEKAGRSDFDVVLCLNVVDRCFSITKMLDDCVRVTRPGGTLIVSVPLPLRQAQHRLGAAQESVWPPLYNKECAWEHAAAWFSKFILKRYGGSQLTLTRLCRAPYMASGAASAPLSVLDGAVFVFRKNPNPLYSSFHRTLPVAARLRKLNIV
eukprot:TRINITY_DN725_c0_g2_i10.p1 TRINITY_DN725_c0_g2~~TRINITY_DN725_c0_g2_i10.p1  ORF type:complete len:437 (+),score=110.73 TRINITY_DN725_c0_g2_i10:42-1352(+)